MQLESGGPAAVGGEVLSTLAEIARTHGLDGLAGRLAEVQALAAEDLAACSDALAGVPARSMVERSARHLLDLGGKRLRPICVSLCARLGTPRGPVVRDLATAVELVHSATLLHDDVVDVGDTRRGRPTARMVYGNAASVFAGDWLLVDALRRVRAHEVPGALDGLLTTIDEMIAAESLQLENRGKLRIDRDTYFSVVRGKTAALFRWACSAGARSGGLGDAEVAALAAYGEHLGLAFQLVDDVLDLEGDAIRTGKEPFIDLREGKATYPLIVLLEREPSARALLEPFVGDGPAKPEHVERLLAALARTRAAEACRDLATQHANAAVQQTELFHPTAVRDALRTVALASVHRDH